MPALVEIVLEERGEGDLAKSDIVGGVKHAVTRGDGREVEERRDQHHRRRRLGFSREQPLPHRCSWFQIEDRANEYGGLKEAQELEEQEVGSTKDFDRNRCSRAPFSHHRDYNDPDGFNFECAFTTLPHTGSFLYFCETNTGFWTGQIRIKPLLPEPHN